jgi:pectinesterase
MAQDKQKNKNNDQTATLRAHGDNFKLYNVNVVNTRGKGSQALALSAYGDNQGYYGCQFKGFQDTILSEKGHHIFVKSLVQGATDFIFGMHGQAWFEKCDIRVVSAEKGFVTGKFQYVFKLMTLS